MTPRSSYSQQLQHPGLEIQTQVHSLTRAVLLPAILVGPDRLRCLTLFWWSEWPSLLQSACMLKPVSHPVHFKLKDGCSMFLRNGGIHLQDYSVTTQKNTVWYHGCYLFSVENVWIWRKQFHSPGLYRIFHSKSCRTERKVTFPAEFEGFLTPFHHFQRLAHIQLAFRI